jgi:hypothetical protein
VSCKHLSFSLITLAAAVVWATFTATTFAGVHGHRRYPTGNSPTYPNATPHAGFSSSNGYYSGRSRMSDPIPVPVPARLVPPAK